MAIVNGTELENRCQVLFENLGWEVTKEMPKESNLFMSDLALWNNSELYGYVEIITAFDSKALQKRKNEIIDMLSSIKPKIFIITNGFSFDVFYDGFYSTTLSVPPAADDVDRARRLFLYYRKIKEVFKND